MNNISDNNRFFDTKHLNKNLRNTTLRGGAITFTAQIAKLILQTASTMVLARLLTPQDFGLIAMVSAFTGFILIFKDLGLSMATIQKSEITHNQVSTLFWVNVALSVFLMLITAGISPLVAWFYHDPRLLLVTIAIAGGFIFGGLTVQHQSLLRRQMKFKVIAIIDVGSLAAGILTAVVCSLLGMKYWSLVFMQIANAFTAMVGSWIASGWMPGLPKKGSGVRPMLAFGGNLTLFSLVNYCMRNLDNILIGKFRGAAQLGYYSKAYSLLLLPIGQITAPVTSVAIPALSRLQNDPERYRRYYLKAIKLIAYISMPLIVLMGILSKEMILLILGEQWLPAVPIFQILAVAAFLQPVESTIGWIFISLNQTKRMAQLGYITSPIICLSFILGLPWGAMGVALSYTICILIITIPECRFAIKKSPIAFIDVISTTKRPVLLSLSLGIALWVLKLFSHDLNSVIIIIISTITSLLIIAVAAITCKSIKLDIKEIIDLKNTILNFSLKEETN